MSFLFLEPIIKRTFKTFYSSKVVCIILQVFLPGNFFSFKNALYFCKSFNHVHVQKRGFTKFSVFLKRVNLLNPRVRTNFVAFPIERTRKERFDFGPRPGFNKQLFGSSREGTELDRTCFKQFLYLFGGEGLYKTSGVHSMSFLCIWWALLEGGCGCALFYPIHMCTSVNMSLAYIWKRRILFREYCFGEENSLSLTEFW